MANIIYTKIFEQLTNGSVDFDDAATVVRFLAERDTSSYTPNKDHDFVSDLTGLVEITASGYARVNVGSKAVNIDDANDRVELDFGDFTFGASVAAGQTAQALIAYVQTGGDDASPTNDPLIAYIDTATGLPAATGGGAFNVTVDTEGFLQLSQP